MNWTWTTTSWPLPFEPRAIFHALTDPGELKRWFAEEVQVDPVPGGPYRFWGRYTPGTRGPEEADQILEEVVPDQGITFRWTLLGVPTRVRITVEPRGKKGSVISVEHSGEQALGIPRDREFVDDFWRLSFGNLGAHLAGGSGLLRPDFDDPAPEIRLAIVIDAPPSAVFRALMEPELVNRWVGSTSAQVDPRVGGAYSYGWEYEIDGRTVQGGPTRILELEENRRLVVDWPDWRGDESVTGQTVTFTLHPEGDGTRVELLHSGFTRVADISDYPFGWGHFLNELRKVSEG